MFKIWYDFSSVPELCQLWCLYEKEGLVGPSSSSYTANLAIINVTCKHFCRFLTLLSPLYAPTLCP